MKPQPSPTFFTDRDLGRALPDALKSAGLSVERHDDHFEPTTPDVRWLEVIGPEGWVALSHNKRIRYNPEERDMVMRAGVPVFMLIGKYPHSRLAQNFLNTRSKVIAFLKEHSPPFIAKIYLPAEADFEEGKPGRVEMWLTHEQWREAVGL